MDSRWFTRSGVESKQATELVEALLLRSRKRLSEEISELSGGVNELNDELTILHLIPYVELTDINMLDTLMRCVMISDECGVWSTLANCSLIVRPDMVRLSTAIASLSLSV